MNTTRYLSMTTMTTALSLWIGCEDTSRQASPQNPVDVSPQVALVPSDKPRLAFNQDEDERETKMETAVDDEFALVLNNPNLQPETVSNDDASIMNMWREEAKEPRENALKTDYVTVAQNYMKEGDLKRAIEAYQNAIYISDVPENWARLGEAYLLSKQHDRGVKYLEHALETDGSLDYARTLLLGHYIDHKKSDQALFHALRLFRHSETVEKRQYLFGRAFMMNAMWKEATRAFQNVLAVAPESLWAANNGAYSSLQTGEHILAVSFLEPFVESARMTPMMYNTLGIAYEESGRPIDAALAYQKAINDRPTYVKAKINKARIWASLSEKQRDEASGIVARSSPDASQKEQRERP